MIFATRTHHFERKKNHAVTSPVNMNRKAHQAQILAAAQKIDVSLRKQKPSQGQIAKNSLSCKVGIIYGVAHAIHSIFLRLCFIFVRTVLFVPARLLRIHSSEFGGLGRGEGVSGRTALCDAFRI